MKKSVWFILVLIIAALSVMSACTAPRERYYDQMGNKYWCNVDSDGCWVTGEEGEHIYIMFWSAASAAKFMGADSNAPLGIHPGTAELPLLPPRQAVPPAGSGPVDCRAISDVQTCEKTAGCHWRKTVVNGVTIHDYCNYDRERPSFQPDI